MRRCGQEQSMLEPLRDIANRLGELARYRVARAAGRGGMMRLADDQERAGTELAEHVEPAGRIGLVDQEAVRNNEPRSGPPRIIGEAPRAADFGDAFAVDDDKGQTEF